MTQYPRPARSARIKCIPCNAPVVETVGGGYVCVCCGESPVAPHADASEETPVID